MRTWYLWVWYWMVLTEWYGTGGHVTCVDGTDWAVCYWGGQVMHITCDYRQCPATHIPLSLCLSAATRSRPCYPFQIPALTLVSYNLVPSV